LLGWTAKREFEKINYHIHTDAVKQHLVPKELTPKQAAIIYAHKQNRHTANDHISRSSGQKAVEMNKADRLDNSPRVLLEIIYCN